MTGEVLPWEVRNALGHFLSRAEMESDASSGKKSKFLEQLSARVQKSDNELAKEQWALFARLKVRDPSGALRKHTKSSLYDAIKSCLDRERELIADAPTEHRAADTSEFIEDVEASVSQLPPVDDSAVDELAMLADAAEEPPERKPKPFPRCALELFNTLNALS